MSDALAFGILIGGRGSRLGGAAKGLLAKPDGALLIEHLVAQCRLSLDSAPIYLLGGRVEYRHLGLPMLADTPPGVGPIGGLHSLLSLAFDQVVLLACDLPYIDRTVLTALLRAPMTGAVAATRGQPPRWEPMCSRYRVPTTLSVLDEQLDRGDHSVTSLLESLNASPLSLEGDDAGLLDDWDTPEDMNGDRRR